jgi:hypothetical protein
MRRAVGCLALASAFLFAPADRLRAETASAEPQIVWEVKNRFRLFRHESDFRRHVEAAQGGSVLEAERWLTSGTGGRGWARVLLNSLCVRAGGRIVDDCERDGVKESYLAPDSHRVGVRLEKPLPAARCSWTFESPENQPQQTEADCAEEVRVRVPYGHPTVVALEVASADGVVKHARTEILVRDLLIAGIGDSIASGEGNPDRPVALSDQGFCFRRAGGVGRSEYFRPGRAAYRGNRTCETVSAGAGPDPGWARSGANWMSAACHHSLYSYQLRTALALAVEQRHVAVTYLPLACTGAEIDQGLLASRRARDTTCGNPGRKGNCPTNVPAQVSRMQDALKAARRRHPDRTYDMVLLTIGANDIGFSELVADIMLEESAERRLAARGGSITSIETAREALKTKLPGRFAQMRQALGPLVGDDLSRVVYVTYANPAMRAPGKPCGGGRDGFDIHPAFTVDPERLAHAVEFVEREFLPGLKALALCEGGVICRGESERMTFVDAHQPAFVERGFCVRAESDPDFDRACFSPKGESFHDNPVAAAKRPLVCGQSVREFRAYASRARWIRTPNDSYFVAMTYTGDLSAVMQPADIHDALWGVTSAVYGGAIHPTAEGHAAMADAALPAARRVLGLEESRAEIEAAPLPPPPGVPARPARVAPIIGGPPN